MLDRPHVISVGYSQAHGHALDFDNYRISVLLHEQAAKVLPPATAQRFNELSVFAGGGPSNTDLTGYDQAADEILDRAAALADRYGPPTAVVGLFENTVMPAAMIRERWSVPGVDVATATRFRNKVRMKEALRGTVPVPRFWAVGSGTPASVVEEIAQLPGKIIMKPVDQAASVGIRLFADGQEFREHAQTVGLPAGYEVEEFVEGRICFFDGVIRDGVVMLFVASRYVGNIFDFRYTGAPIGTVTFDDPELIERGLTFTQSALTALGLRDSSFHLESFLTPDDEFVFLEVACRFGGAGISAHLQTVYGIDIVAESVRACLHQPSAYAVPTRMTQLSDVGASGFLWTPLVEQRRSIVRRIHGLEMCPDSVVASEIPDIGRVLNDHIGVWSASGKFILAGPDSAAVEADMAAIARAYRLELAICE